jgi:hypothetical protein
MKLGWKTRIGLVLSAVWLCLVLLVSEDYRRLGQVLGFGLLPLVVIWGVVWAIAGWRAQRPPKLESQEAVRIEKRRKRRDGIRTFLAVVAVLGIGIFAANWQFHSADNEAGSRAVAGWFGEWLVYGLFAYAIFRAIPRQPPGMAAVLASLVIVGAVNYKAYAAITEDRQAMASLAKAAPWINKIQSGALVSDQEIRDAKIGLMEPLMLAQAGYSREILVAASNYASTTDSMQPELMLTPSALASPSARAQTRIKLKLWQQATADYKSQLEAAKARGKLAVRAAQSQMPASIAGSASKGFDEGSENLSVYVDTVVSTDRDAGQAIAGLLDLMDASPDGYVLDKGPPVNLLFRDEATLAKYRQLIGAVVAASQRQQEGQARLVQVQADRTEKLGRLLKP